MYSSSHLVREGFLTCLSLRSESCLHITNDLQVRLLLAPLSVFLFCFDSFIYNPLHWACRTMAAAAFLI